MALAFRVAATDSTGAFDTAHVAFLDGGAVGPDNLDAYELVGPGAPVLHLFTVVDGEGGPRGFDVAVVPADGAELALGVTTPTEAALVLTWPALAVPDDWTLTLVDVETETEIDLRTAESYAFSAAGTPPPSPSASPLATHALRVATDASAQGVAARFRLRAGLRAATPVEGGPPETPTVLALEAPRPNPVRGISTVPFSLAEAGPTRLSVFDLLGREVAVLAQGERAVGVHTATLNASRLSPGVYVVRLAAGGQALVRRVVVVR